MAIVVKDRVKVSTTTTGTGTITLGSAEPGFQTFSVVGNGNQTYYAVTSGNDFEVGIGTYTDSGTTLSRDTVLESSNSGAKITLAGTSTVFTTYPAERAAFLEDTNQIDMVVASGSDPISPGNVVTRESNGETAKVKKTTTTQNLTLGAATVNVAMPSSTYDWSNSSTNYYAEYPAHSAAVANDSGKYIIVYRAGSNHVRIQIFNYNSASSTWSTHTGQNRSLTSPDSTYTTGPAIQGTGNAFNGDASLHYLRWNKNMNSSAGGTYMIIWQYNHSAGNQSRYVTPMTIDGSDHVTLYNRLAIIQGPTGMPNATAQAYFSTDTSVVSMTTDKTTFVSAGYHYVYWASPYRTYLVITTAEVEWTGSSYQQNYISRQYFTDINGNSTNLTNQPRPIRVMYDYTNTRLCTFWLDNNRRNRFTVWNNTGSASSPTWTAQYTEQLTTSNNNGTFDNAGSWAGTFQKADGKGRVLFSYRHTYYSPSTTYGAVWLAISPGASSLTIQTVASTNSTNSQQHGAPVQSFHYDYLNDRYIVPYSGSLSRVGQGQHMRIYVPSGTGITQDSAVSGGGSGSAYQWGRSLAIVDTMSITSISNANAGKWLQVNDTDASTYSSLSANGQNSFYSAGNIPHTLTTSTTNKALSFGFGQQVGSAGDTITVLPFDSEGIEQNQSSLTHGTKYFVSSTGALVTNTTPDPDINGDTDNPFAGQAIQTTNLRLPTKEVSDGSGGDARIFCGSYDFRVDGGSTAENVLISLPADQTAANVRSYEINVHALNFAGSGDFLCMLPYNGNSSVYTGPTYNTFTYMNSNSGNATNNSKTQSTAFILNWSNGTSYDLYSGNTPTQQKQTYDNASGHGGQLVCRAVYTNSLRNGSLYYDASWRYESGNHSQSRVLSISSADAATTSNYADGFYFYCGNSSQATISRAIMEGVISVYAIIG